ncbi:hypothetical protein [Microbacterium indicum]|uniref:hypothetical protein n=1 Tax=Microbacterium indicum TaxID=358100 RepID=UPI000402B754|nr:hypothetical protein [Microbacterium indicum]
MDDKPIGSTFAAAFRSSKLRAGDSRFVFNETARAWSVTAEQSESSQGVRLPGQAKVYETSPNPLLPVRRIWVGTVIETAIVAMTEHVDSQIVLDVEQEIEVAPGEPWMP